jgi:asparagine synthase (glutamine-hydrolysing)
MCGIAGAFSFSSNSLVGVEKVKLMTDSIAHRGPDGEGVWQSANSQLVLGHRRLAIIDLSDLSNQPMIDISGKYVIVFNGEIYNFCELKEQLVSLGCDFFSHSDTEVLLNLYIRFGESCLQMLDGMFAFVIYDIENNRLFCARDRFGEKPFYYVISNGEFVFASEIKAIKAYYSDLSIDYDKLQRYLNGDYWYGDIDTPFNEVVTLNPASYMTVDSSGINLMKYWDIDLNKKYNLVTDHDYFNKFQELFLKSVKVRLRSDVPVGSSLSGGLDSSAVVGSFSSLGVVDNHTFSARFKSNKDEGKWIADVVEKHNLTSHEVWPAENGLIDDIEKITWHNEFPLASGSVYAQWCVMALPRKYGVKVLLDGQGADEFLCGYDELKYYAIWDLFRSGNLSAFLKEKKLFDEYYGSHGKIGFMFVFDGLLKQLGIRRKVYENGFNLKEQLKYYTQHKLGELLRYADRNSMANSIEVRLPFLSHELVEFVFSIPDNLIYREGKTKYILREAMKNVLPDSVYNRTNKIGFAPPQSDWVDSEIFQNKYKEVAEVLSEVGIMPGPDQFRNLAASVFVKLYR